MIELGSLDTSFSQQTFWIFHTSGSVTPT